MCLGIRSVANPGFSERDDRKRAQNERLIRTDAQMRLSSVSIVDPTKASLIRFRLKRILSDCYGLHAFTLLSLV